MNKNVMTTLKTSHGEYKVARLGALTEAGMGHVERLPYTIKIVLESCLRNHDGELFRDEHVEALVNYNAKDPGQQEVPFKPGRVLLQDLTGVPALVDLAALRDAVVRAGGDPATVNPSLRVDLVMDHSVQVDVHGSVQALLYNRQFEFARNQERYQFLKWGEKAFENFSLVPPGAGIVHQVNLEYLAAGVLVEEHNGERVAFPDTLVGADSHTTMINGLGVVGWGVGGIEAEACMLGQPIPMLLPEVIGVALEGRLPEGTTATDLVLTITELLRAHNVVGKVVEFYGRGLSSLSLADRATIANMAPEYGATMGYFPIDDNTLRYLTLTGRGEEQVELVGAYAKLQGLWHDPNEERDYSSNLHVDLSQIEASLAGPKRPQDRVRLPDMKSTWVDFFHTTAKGREPKEVVIEMEGKSVTLKDGAIAIAAITSCTNTSNPGVMIAAGLVAQKADELGLRARPWVKTSLAPGSRVVTDYLEAAGLDKALEAVGFYTVGYGCTTCLGNSGPLPQPIIDAVEQDDVFVTSVLSGNRNFEGRVSPQTRGNFLASPPLVVAYAIAGTVDIDLTTEPLGRSDKGKPVFLKDIWPSNEEIQRVQELSVTQEQFVERYRTIYEGQEDWNQLKTTSEDVYSWSKDSTYLQEPPFFVDLSEKPERIKSIQGARCLVKVGDSITTDHISPAGAIPMESPTARYLQEHGVDRRDFNTYGTRRGNDLVMARGTFGNIRLRNHLAPGYEGGYTTYYGPKATTPHAPTPGEVSYIYDASVAYQQHNIPLVVLAGDNYGMGSSRDWAAKGPSLLGVRAVIARSYERIHRSNLLGMGILPLQFHEGESCESLGLTGQESFDIQLDETLTARQSIQVIATSPNGTQTDFTVQCRIDSPVEITYYRNGGILHTVLRNILQN